MASSFSNLSGINFSRSSHHRASLVIAHSFTTILLSAGTVYPPSPSVSQQSLGSRETTGYLTDEVWGGDDYKVDLTELDVEQWTVCLREGDKTAVRMLTEKNVDAAKDGELPWTWREKKKEKGGDHYRMGKEK
ncbi:hypothetical protein HPP92_013569 [Vanilla planifolia]|uniref:Uncharacterized protein n=1 Tax=Vanilla planifolia TaxID=51239 RepID=A0A835QRY9_VANPL|nr:hypothetical protein HPP92_013569 [Vanilla planifolia]